MPHSQPPADLLETIRKGRRFIVASHQRPDGDAIGSAMAMALALRAIGKDATVRRHAGVPAAVSRRRRHPDHAGRRQRVDAALILECGELARTGVTGLIDHR